MSVSFDTLALAKQYTNDSLAGTSGALKGSPCEIQSITPTADGNEVVFSWTNSKGVTQTESMIVKNGTNGSDGKDGKNGEDGFSPTITAIETDDGVTFTITNKNSEPITVTVKKGEKGERGERGEIGATPVINATASVSNTTGEPSVTITKGGTDSEPTFDFAFNNIKGEQGEQGKAFTYEDFTPEQLEQLKGEKGDISNISVNATADDISSDTPTVDVTKSGTIAEPIFDFAFHGLKGQKGDKGDNGSDGFTPTITENAENTESSYKLDIKNSDGSFTTPNLKGAKGDTGAKGEDGTNGITPNVSMTASVDNTIGTPSVAVTKGGTTEAPSFNLAISGVKGEKGEQGIQGVKGNDGDDGFSPTVTADKANTTDVYKLDITTKDGSFTTPNLKGAKGDTGAKGEDGKDAKVTQITQAAYNALTSATQSANVYLITD